MAENIDGLQAHEQALTDHTMEALAGLNYVEVYGKAADKGPVIAFNMTGVHPHDVATILDREGVAVRAGHHCCQPLMTALGQASTARASFAAYTTHDEIDRFIAALTKAHRLFGCPP